MRVRRITPYHEQAKKRVAAYARVSTLTDNQEDSFETQVDYYTRFIQANPEWEFVGVFADQGVTGTSTKKRADFNKMLRKAKSGEIDLILVKSISRFSRNVVDCQRLVEELKDANVEVRFEREGISSFDSTSGFIFSLLSAVAQDESRSISENVRWGYQERFKRGEYCLGNNRILGYDTDPKTKKLVPNKDAWIIRQIFDLFISGETYQGIADAINAMGAKRLHKKKPFTPSVVQYIVSNESYVGDKLLQKQAPADFLTKRPDPNVSYESHYLTDDHEGIIDRGTWEEALAILNRRRAEVAQGIQKRGVTHHAFYGKLFCGECGEAYTRRTFTVKGRGKADYYYHAWNCRERQKGKKGNGCQGRTMREEELEKLICVKQDWESFDAERFDREVERVEVGEIDIMVRTVTNTNNSGKCCNPF